MVCGNEHSEVLRTIHNMNPHIARFQKINLQLIFQRRVRAFQSHRRTRPFLQLNLVQTPHAGDGFQTFRHGHGAAQALQQVQSQIDLSTANLCNNCVHGRQRWLLLIFETLRTGMTTLQRVGKGGNLERFLVQLTPHAGVHQRGQFEQLQQTPVLQQRATPNAVLFRQVTNFFRRPFVHYGDNDRCVGQLLQQLVEAVVKGSGPPLGFHERSRVSRRPGLKLLFGGGKRRSGEDALIFGGRGGRCSGSGGGRSQHDTYTTS